MIRLLIFAGAAFLLGLGGSTGVVVLTAPARPPGADSLAVAHADSARATPAPQALAPSHAPGSDSLARPAAPPPGSAVAASATPRGPVVTTVTPAAGPAAHAGPITSLLPAPAAAALSVPSLRTDVPDLDRYKQVGSILLNMKPAEAARILGYLNDDQVEGLLRSMSPRNAAGLLSQLPPERAAVQSRRLLVPRPQEATP